MARIADLVKPGERCLLHHPICGWVIWTESSPGSGDYVLLWAIGPERDETVAADSVILFDENWKFSNNEEIEKHYKDSPSIKDLKRWTIDR
jgi:hypothetical protein